MNAGPAAARQITLIDDVRLSAVDIEGMAAIGAGAIYTYPFPPSAAAAV